jgi:hypothetical protein
MRKLRKMRKRKVLKYLFVLFHKISHIFYFFFFFLSIFLIFMSQIKFQISHIVNQTLYSLSFQSHSRCNFSTTTTSKYSWGLYLNALSYVEREPHKHQAFEECWGTLFLISLYLIRCLSDPP